MTDNQEKELFKILSNLVAGVNKIQTDVSELKAVQKEHTKILNRLDAKTDTVAGKVMDHEVRLTKAERNIEELKGGVH